MKPITQEWVDKAEADYAAALLFRKSRKKFSRDITCFHVQLCLEKYLKGRLRAIASSPGDKFQQIIMIPAGVEAFAFDAGLDAGVQLQQIQCDAA